MFSLYIYKECHFYIKWSCLFANNEKWKICLLKTLKVKQFSDKITFNNWTRLSNNTNNEALAKTKLNIIVFYAQTQTYVNYNAHRNLALQVKSIFAYCKIFQKTFYKTRELSLFSRTKSWQMALSLHDSYQRIPTETVNDKQLTNTVMQV